MAIVEKKDEFILPKPGPNDDFGGIDKRGNPDFEGSTF
jgi:hypothetical protein